MPTLTFSSFGAMLLAATAAMVSYVVWRTAGVPWLAGVSWPWRLAAGAAAWLAVWLGRSWGHAHDGPVAAMAELAGMNVLGVVFIAFWLMALVDAATVFGLLLPRLAPMLRGLALAACLALSCLALFQGMRPPVVTEHEVRLPGLPAELDGLTVAALSDLHVGAVLGPDWLRARVDQAMALGPDVVVLLGDVFDGHGMPPKEELLPVLRGLSAPLGVYAVQGNHEYFGGRDNPLELMAEAGYRVLYNRWEEPAPGLVLAGVEDLSMHSRRGRLNDPLAEALAGRPRGATVLLSHSPLRAEQAAAAGVGLMLSGHTHSGQIWPFRYLVQRRYPLLEGLYDVGPMAALVCRGTGTWGPRMRLWKPGEILRVTLRAE